MNDHILDTNHIFKPAYFRVFPHYNGFIYINKEDHNILNRVIDKYNVDWTVWNKLMDVGSFEKGIRAFIDFCKFVDDKTNSLENKTLEEAYLLFKLSSE